MMREARKPKIVPFSSLKWLIDFLNLKLDSKKATDKKQVEEILGMSWSRDDVTTSLKAQQKLIDLMDLALKADSPEGLIMALNDYIADNSESGYDPHRQYSPVRPYWYARPLNEMTFLRQGQAILKMGSRKWVVHPAHQMHGAEGQAWLCVIQCLENGEFARLRRCLLERCRCFFDTDDARKKFCKKEHQRKHDAQASKDRVKASRERQKARSLGIKPPKRSPHKMPVSPITEEQRFTEFLTLAKGRVTHESEIAPLVTRIPGKWSTVNKWLGQSGASANLWGKLDKTTKTVFRKEWGLNY